MVEKPIWLKKRRWLENKDSWKTKIGEKQRWLKNEDGYKTNIVEN